MHLRSLGIVCLILAGCTSDTDNPVEPVDFDGDGYAAEEDCNDEDSAIHPGATETCDGIDNNCDGQADEAVTLTWYTDADGDGYGAANAPVKACTQPDGAVDNTDDCNDQDPERHPGTVWYADLDGDGHGNLDQVIEQCDRPANAAAISGDCDDTRGSVYPGNEERCDGFDNNCNGSIDGEDAINRPTWYVDGDGDGYGDINQPILSCEPPLEAVTNSTDCDDRDPTVSPNATEICDDVDNNCNGLLDDDDPSVVGLGVWYSDADHDGYGDASQPKFGCIQPHETADNTLDCNDSDPAIQPQAAEFCDGFDNNCNGAIDDADPSVIAQRWYADGDGDGFGNDSISVYQCAPPAGYAGFPGDCQDTDSRVFPGNSELCDGLDNDCNGTIDDGFTWYVDADTDGFGDPSTLLVSCTPPVGMITNGLDCNDTDPAIAPGADEFCDGIDTDCNGEDDDDYARDALLWYADTDGDTFGDAFSSTYACRQPTGFTADDTDCDDRSAAAHPGGTEVADFLDNDCNGLIDDIGLPCTFPSMPHTVELYEWSGADYYLAFLPCCGQYDELYDMSCNYICAPSGGITGMGDGHCPTFWTQANLLGSVYP